MGGLRGGRKNGGEVKVKGEARGRKGKEGKVRGSKGKQGKIRGSSGK